MKKENYTDKELKLIERLTDSLIIWMFHNPNNRYPIEETVKEAYLLGKKLKK